jgi:hypothetical protein
MYFSNIVCSHLTDSVCQSYCGVLNAYWMGIVSMEMVLGVQTEVVVKL